ncbi:helix-turn-helix domain-containing protein [Roseomonas sp. CCTCC AB2023176]|uniref:helix-turn-helix domain-containing protein n=1 Tax=Roseomonas sp. CCTCC AB2023176 TaxID=3342640 RepID=UPI0035DD66A2
MPRGNGRSSGPGAEPLRSTAGGVAAVGRALQVLGAFRAGDSALPLRVFAARTGLYKSTILRLLASLEKAGAVIREADASWSPGPTLYLWGTFYLRSLGLDTRAAPVVDGLSEDTGGIAAFWARLDPERRICIYRALPPRSPRHALTAGDVMPMGGHATAQVFAAWDRHADPAAAEDRPEVVVSPARATGTRPPSLRRSSARRGA